MSYFGSNVRKVIYKTNNIGAQKEGRKKIPSFVT